MIALLAALCCVALWLGLTLSGARWTLDFALDRVNRGAGFELDAEVAAGSLWNGLELRDVRYADPASGAELDIGELGFAWQPLALLQRRVLVDELGVTNLNFRSGTSREEDDGEPFDVRRISDWFGQLPVSIELRRALGVNLGLELGEQRYVLEQLDFAALLDDDALALQLAGASLREPRVGLNGELRLARDLALEGTLQWRLDGLPRPEQGFAGALALDGSLLELELEHVLNRPWQLSSEGRIVTGLGAAPFSLALEHHLAEADMAAFGQPDLVLSQLEARTEGDLDALDLNASLELRYPQLEAVQLVLDSRYLGDRVELRGIEADSEQIGLRVSGEYGIDSGELQLDWDLDELTLQQVLSGFELRDIRGNGQLRVASGEDGVDAEIALDELQGTLNDYALRADGTVSIVDSVLRDVDLQARSGDNSLRVGGAVEPQLALEWTLDAPALQQLWGRLDGRLQGQGSLSGSFDEPRLSGGLDGENLSLDWGGSSYRLVRLEASADTSAGNNRIGLELDSLQQVGAGGVARDLLRSANLELAGNPQQHRLRAELAGNLPGGDSELELALQGSLNETPDGRQWQGSLDSAALRSPYGDWTLPQAAALRYGPEGFSVQRHCWEQQVLGLCAALALDAGGALDAELELSDVPLDWLNREAQGVPRGLKDLQQAYGIAAPQEVEFGGSTGVQASIEGFVDGAWENLRAELRPSDVSIRVTRQVESERESLPPEISVFRFDEVHARVDSEGETWRGQAGFRVSQMADPEQAGDEQLTRLTESFQGSFDAQFALDASQRLSGELTLDFDELAWLESLYYPLHESAGVLHGSATLGGTRQNPEVMAELQVRQGSFQLPDYGLDIRDLELDMNSSSEQAELHLAASSGEGQLSLDARLLRPLEPGRELSAMLDGEEFTLMDTEAALIRISPDLELSLGEDGLVVNGSVTVPEADVKLESWVDNVGSGGVAVSQDVVIVQDDPDATLADRGEPLPLEANLTLALGEEVRLSGFGLQARLNGQLTLEQQANRPLLAYGELGIPEGSYRIYNQQLNTRDGRLLFYGNLLNPVLDIRAYRETPTAEVGMILSGSVNDIQGSLYSTPALPDNEILALLITGKSFNNVDGDDGDVLLSAVTNFGLERGGGLTSAIGDKLGLDNVALSSGSSYQDSSLGLGKYLTPDLLMSYEIGLFDRQMVLSIDYRLTERLKLEVKSGISQSVDLSYTVEKD